MPLPADLTVDLGTTSNRTVLSLPLTTVGQPSRAGEPSVFTFGTVGPASNSTWVQFVAPTGSRTGVLRMSPTSATYVVNRDPQEMVFYWALYRDTDGTFAGLSRLRADDQFNYGPKSLRLNCEGYAQGRDISELEWAWGEGDVFYLQIATGLHTLTPYGYSAFPAPFALELVVDEMAEPVTFDSPPTDPVCVGTPLATHGSEVRYYNVRSCWPTRLAPGSGAFDATMFAVEEWIESSDDVHYRAFTVTWAGPGQPPVRGGFLSPSKRFYTWERAEDHELSSDGFLGTSDGQNHHAMYHSTPPPAPPLIWSTTGGAGTSGTDSWGKAWWVPIWSAGASRWRLGSAGPGQSNRVLFGYDVVPGGNGIFLALLDLAGNLVETHTVYPPGASYPTGWHGRPTVLTNDGTTALSLMSGWAVHMLDLATDTWTSGPAISGLSGSFLNATVDTVRPDGSLLVSGFQIGMGNAVAIIDATYSTATVQPLLAGTSPSGTIQLGYSADGTKALCSELLGSPVAHGSGRHHLYSHVWWVDLGTGAATDLFTLRHPFHDTAGVLDVESLFALRVGSIAL